VLPKVSVVLTSYNHERYLGACLESALTQTYSNVEIIAIDDCSKDKSRDILAAYADSIRLILNEQNQGTYGVLNQGLAAASAEYIAVLNSDDLWLPHKLEKQVALMEQNAEMSFCHTFGDFIDASGNVVGGRPMGFPFPRTGTGWMLPTFIANNTAIASSVLMRTETAHAIGGFDSSFKNLGDWDMWIRLAERGSVGFVDEKLTLYRVHGANTIYNIEVTRAEEMRLRESAFLRHAGKAREPSMQKALAHTAACLGSLYSITGDPQKARELYVESIRLNPVRIKSYLRYLLTFAPLSIRRRTL
jgi:glycosyltransferase involved in cell wall biosynthesis